MFKSLNLYSKINTKIIVLCSFILIETTLTKSPLETDLFCCYVSRLDLLLSLDMYSC